MPELPPGILRREEEKGEEDCNKQGKRDESTRDVVPERIVLRACVNPDGANAIYAEGAGVAGKMAVGANQDMLALVKKLLWVDGVVSGDGAVRFLVPEGETRICGDRGSDHRGGII